jgi:hypothetical protein
MMAKRKNMEATGKRERNKEIRIKSKEARMPWGNEGQHTTSMELGGAGKREIRMAKKTQKAARIPTKKKQRLEMRTGPLKKEGSELWKETKPWTTHSWKNAQTNAVRANEEIMRMTQPRKTHSNEVWRHVRDQELSRVDYQDCPPDQCGARVGRHRKRRLGCRPTRRHLHLTQ